MPTRLRVLGFAGSLRKGSYNRALLNTAVELAPDTMEFIIFDLASIPFYNQDIEDYEDPASVTAFKRAIAESDALLICTPEYNYSIPGVLKNALDWASRSAKTTPLQGKPVAVMGASTGGFGTARCQMALQNLFAACGMHPLNSHRVLIAHAEEKFDESGRLIDTATRRIVKESLTALAEWTLILQRGKTSVQKV